MLLSDSESSDDDNDDQPITEARLKYILEEHKELKKCQAMFPSLYSTQVCDKIQL